MDQSEREEILRDQKHILLAAIKKQLGDQKINLLIATKENAQTYVFLQMIMPQSVNLKTFY